MQISNITKIQFLIILFFSPPSYSALKFIRSNGWELTKEVRKSCIQRSTLLALNKLNDYITMVRTNLTSDDSVFYNLLNIWI